LIRRRREDEPGSVQRVVPAIPGAFDAPDRILRDVRVAAATSPKTAMLSRFFGLFRRFQPARGVANSHQSP
jgi:hypothetical protein